MLLRACRAVELLKELNVGAFRDFRLPKALSSGGEGAIEVSAAFLLEEFEEGFLGRDVGTAGFGGIVVFGVGVSVFFV